MSKLFLRWFFGVVGALALAILAFNVLADAYILNAPAGPGAQLVTGFERVLKPAWFAAIKPDLVFIGSSRARMAYDPTAVDPAFHVRSFNYGVSSATAYELRRYTQDAVAQPSVKTIVLALDSFTGGAEAQPFGAGFDDLRLAVTPAGLPTPRRGLWLFTSRYMSGGALGMHVLVMGQLLRLKRGQTAADRPDIFTAYQHMTPATYRQEMRRRETRSMDMNAWQTSEMLKALQALCSSPAAVDWYFPSDEFPLIARYVENDAAGFISYKEAVLAAVERHNAACTNKVRLFDFMTLNPITADDAAAHGRPSPYYNNPIHIRPPTGLMLLKQMLAPPGQAGPGVELTNDPNADADIRAITGHVALWRQTHPGE